MKNLLIAAISILALAGLMGKHVEADTLMHWSTATFTNEYGDVTERGVVSNSVTETRKMGFPYTNTKARIWVACSDYSSISFSNGPNLTGGFINDGYEIFWLKGRLDGKKRVEFHVVQSFGDDNLAVVSHHAKKFNQWLSEYHTLEVVLPWYGEGNVVFKFSLHGYQRKRQEVCGS